MAPVSGVEESERGRRGGELSLDDCRCPVCLEIFMEPVTLPCTHTFCKACFLESVDKATMCCPLCRKRVSTWARVNSRKNSLVNQQLWKQIQTSFPLQCERRLSGQDAVAEDDLEVLVCFPRVSQPGELRQEYEDQVTKNSAAVSQENIRPDVTPAKKKEVCAGQIEKFLCPRPSKSSSSDCSSPSSFTANKENILLSQVKLQAESPLPKLDYYGTQTNGDTSESPSLHPTSPSASVEDQLLPRSLRTYLSGDGGPLSAKRKSSEVETTEDEEVMATKRVCPPSSSSSTTLDVGGSALQGIAEWEAELLNRRRQEEEDRRLALLLQKELDQEEKQKATNRRKGSSDAYPLRQNRKGKVETSSSNTPSRPPRKTSKTPHSSSASSVKTTNSSSSSRGSKQATLTEMFSSLSS